MSSAFWDRLWRSAGIQFVEDHCAEIGSLTRGFLERVMPA